MVVVSTAAAATCLCYYRLVAHPADPPPAAAASTGRAGIAAGQGHPVRLQMAAALPAGSLRGPDRALGVTGE